MRIVREATPMMTNGGRSAEARVDQQCLGRVLLLEDEKDVAELIRYNLAREGYGVLLTTNGADALRLVRETRPDVVLLVTDSSHAGNLTETRGVENNIRRGGEIREEDGGPVGGCCRGARGGSTGQDRR